MRDAEDVKERRSEHIGDGVDKVGEPGGRICAEEFKDESER